MGDNLALRVARLVGDAGLAMTSFGPSLGQVLDRGYMASWRFFREFEADSVTTLLDIGAHDGHYAILASRYFPLKRAVLVEPLPEKRTALEALQIPNLTVVTSALSNFEGTASFKVNATSQASSLLKINPTMGSQWGLDFHEIQEIDVPVTTLDALAVGLQLQAIDLLKIDVQGAERDVLLGGSKTLPSVKYIQVELLFADHYDGSGRCLDIHNILVESGFEVTRMFDFARGPRGNLLQCDAIYQNRRLFS